MMQLMIFIPLIFISVSINNKGHFKILKNEEKLAEKCSFSDRKYYINDLGGDKILKAHHYAFGFWMRKGGSF